MVHEHLDRNDVGLTKVVDKTTNVSITPRIDAVRITILRKKGKAINVILNEFND